MRLGLGEATLAVLNHLPVLPVPLQSFEKDLLMIFPGTEGRQTGQ